MKEDRLLEGVRIHELMFNTKKFEKLPKPVFNIAKAYMEHIKTKFNDLNKEQK